MAVRCSPPSREANSSDHGDDVADASCWGGLMRSRCHLQCICSYSLAGVCLGVLAVYSCDTWQAYLLQHAPRRVVVCVPLCLPSYFEPRPKHAYRQQQAALRTASTYICCAPETASKRQLVVNRNAPLVRTT